MFPACTISKQNKFKKIILQHILWINVQRPSDLASAGQVFKGNYPGFQNISEMLPVKHLQQQLHTVISSPFFYGGNYRPEYLQLCGYCWQQITGIMQKMLNFMLLICLCP